MAIPERFIDELVTRTDIVDLVSEYVRLNKKGRNYWGLCPFHSEKTPSFSVSADKQIYKCFGCGKGGGAINFVMEVDNLPYIDAVKVLAKRANLEVPETGSTPGMRERRQKLLEINPRLNLKPNTLARRLNVQVQELKELYSIRYSRQRSAEGKFVILEPIEEVSDISDMTDT